MCSIVLVFGFFNVNKPTGPTSHDIVAGIRRLLPPRTKVGHAGTLDPFATGVLVICVGPATRLADYVQRRPKRYEASITLGFTSTTDDTEGDIAEVSPPGKATPSEAEVRRVLGGFVGQIRQTPPSHSAVHVAGRRAYKLARAGERLHLPARTVAIERIELLSYEYPLLQIDVRCGSGTYIRALARDIGEALGVGGYCSALTRTQVGPFTLDAAVAIDKLNCRGDLIGPLAALADLPKIALDTEQAGKLAMGQAVELKAASQGQLADSVEVAAVDERGNLLATAKVSHKGRWTIRPTRVFAGRR